MKISEFQWICPGCKTNYYCINTKELIKFPYNAECFCGFKGIINKYKSKVRIEKVVDYLGIVEPHNPAQERGKQ